jgi:hypothetical protein
MISKPDQHPILEDYLLNFSDHELKGAELTAFLEYLESDSHVKRIAATNHQMREALQSLPVVKARKGFDQRMAARFALELELESVRENASRIDLLNETRITSR